MGIKVSNDWITVYTENSDHWSDQSFTIKRELISSVRLVKAITKPQGPDNGLEINVAHKDVMQTRHWMRYQDYEKAAQDYAALINELHNA